MRHAVFAEQAGQVLGNARSIQNTPFSRAMSPDERGRLAKAKLAAADDIATFEPMLYPPDVN